MAYAHSIGATSISLQHLADALLYGLPLPPHSFVVTFDDGRLSQWTNAAPILREYGFTAVFFPCTALIGGVYGPQQYMTGAQLRELAATGFSFGDHTLKDNVALWAGDGHHPAARGRHRPEQEHPGEPGRRGADPVHRLQRGLAGTDPVLRQQPGGAALRDPPRLRLRGRPPGPPGRLRRRLQHRALAAPPGARGPRDPHLELGDLGGERRVAGDPRPRAPGWVGHAGMAGSRRNRAGCCQNSGAACRRPRPRPLDWADQTLRADERAGLIRRPRRREGGSAPPLQSSTAERWSSSAPTTTSASPPTRRCGEAASRARSRARGGGHRLPPPLRLPRGHRRPGGGTGRFPGHRHGHRRPERLRRQRRHPGGAGGTRRHHPERRGQPRLAHRRLPRVALPGGGLSPSRRRRPRRPGWRWPPDARSSSPTRSSRWTARPPTWPPSTGWPGGTAPGWWSTRPTPWAPPDREDAGSAPSWGSAATTWSGWSPSPRPWARRVPPSAGRSRSAGSCSSAGAR